MKECQNFYRELQKSKETPESPAKQPREDQLKSGVEEKVIMRGMHLYEIPIDVAKQQTLPTRTTKRAANGPKDYKVRRVQSGKESTGRIGTKDTKKSNNKKSSNKT